MPEKIVILILGASGMLGHKVFEVLSSNTSLTVYGTINGDESFKLIPATYSKNIINNINLLNMASLVEVINKIKPNFIINAVGVIKQKNQNNQLTDNYNCIYLNSLLPHQLSKLCTDAKCRLIHISTDCVFNGLKGTEYNENDEPTCQDSYGMSKYLGEVAYNNTLTLRTSIIGHELNSKLSLLDWFLYTKETSVKGYDQAIFSGFTTLELAIIIEKIISTYPDLNGLYQLSSNAIDKYSLLNIIKTVYSKNIKITPDSAVKINRSLNSDKLKKILNYTPPGWNLLVQNMYQNFITSPFYNDKNKDF